jgi:hypothetical protein
MKFFNKLPIISYNGQVARNFLARARLTEQTRNNHNLFYPYTVTEQDRIDHISHKYYDDSDYMWMIYLANDIVDPYFDLYLNDTNFDRYITDKYGSIANAQQQIVYWRNNWETDDTELSLSGFESLPDYAKKYYGPKVDRYNNAYSYERKQEDWIVDTNQIVSIVVEATGTFTIGEKVTQTATVGGITANAVVTFANSTQISLKHVVGEVLASNSTVTTTITGLSSGATANAQSLSVQYAIPETEAVFWSPVSYYDHEAENNARKKTIQLIDTRLKGEVERELKKVMNG